MKTLPTTCCSYLPKAIVLLSGGLDSASCLAIARSLNFQCYTLSFDYGQRQRSELNAAEKMSKALGATSHRVIRIDMDQLKGSAITDHSLDIPKPNTLQGIPITYVPARNTVFISIAVGWAEVLNAYDVFTGICSIDYSGYPDCRPEYLNSLQHTMDLATKTGVEGKPIKIHAPLLYLSKAEIIKEGVRLGVDYSMTVSCYQATSDGLACGQCDSCYYRRKGFKEANIADSTRYQQGVEK